MLQDPQPSRLLDLVTPLYRLRALSELCVPPLLEGAMGWVEFDIEEVPAGEYKLWATIGSLRNLGGLRKFHLREPTDRALQNRPWGRGRLARSLKFTLVWITRTSLCLSS